MENTCTEVERTSCLASASCSAVRSIGWWPSGRLGMFEFESAFFQQLVLCSQPRRAWAVQVSAQQPVKNTAFEIHHACQRQGLARPQPGAADGIEDTAGKRDSHIDGRIWSNLPCSAPPKHLPAYRRGGALCRLALLGKDEATPSFTPPHCDAR